MSLCEQYIFDESGSVTRRARTRIWFLCGRRGVVRSSSSSSREENNATRPQELVKQALLSEIGNEKLRMWNFGWDAEARHDGTQLFNNPHDALKNVYPPDEVFFQTGKLLHYVYTSAPAEIMIIHAPSAH